MTLQLLALGTNGFYPSFGRQTMSFLLREEKRALLLDAGTGVGRLFVTHCHWLDDVERLEILLTHYHLDHVAGLACLSHAWQKPILIHAPIAPLVDVDDAAATLGRLLSPPLFPVTLADFAASPEVRPYADAPRLDFGLETLVRRQHHAGGSVGVRLGDRLAYVTDTAHDPDTVAFVRGVDRLLHEMWVSDAEGEANPQLLTGHTSVGQLAEITDAARPGVVSPVHHRPDRTTADLDRLHRDLALRTSIPVRPLREGEAVTLSANGHPA